jgi:NAD(P)-dependent dehydrogenase (short-subunit alcohol dehydrogenase family)
LRGAALVTGAGRRIGRALALTAAEAGYDVAVHYRGGRDHAEAVAEEIRGLGRKAEAIGADLSHEDEALGLVTLTAGRLGPVTLLVNNASRFADDRVGGLDRESWDAHLETNLRAPIVLAETFAQQDFAIGTDPLILNVLDQRVWKPNPQFFTYTLTKNALWTATRMLAQALAPRIRVNGVGPGPTLPSPYQSEADFAAEAAATPLKRRAELGDICAAARYLIDAPAVTGQMIAVDGGQHLAWRTPDIIDP